MPLELERLFARRCIPHTGRLIPASREDVLAVGRERNRNNIIAVSLELEHLFARGGIPYTSCAVTIPREDALAIGGERNRGNSSTMPLELARLFARQRNPKQLSKVKSDYRAYFGEPIRL